MNLLPNSTANRSTFPSDSTSINFMFVSIDACVQAKPKLYCYFASFLILFGYLLHLSVFPTPFLQNEKAFERIYSTLQLELPVAL